MKKVFYLAILFFLLSSGVVWAQDTGQEGPLTSNSMGFSFLASNGLTELNYTELSYLLGVNFVYHPISSLAIEPGVYFYSRNREDKNNLTSTSTNREYLTLGASLGIYYYLHIDSGLYFYVGPRLDYYDATNKYESSTSESEDKDSIIGVNVIFGLKYMFNEHVGMFGNCGFAYISMTEKDKDWNSSGTVTGDDEDTNEYFSFSRASLGVTFYF